ncbi:hypothetical protein TRFO_33942 [Tritrichomonas foetus]|uniref:RING-type E3 ubiquitin transferase n=1 Tax=Tritrichomonas foetus TaxID=1144522 RepID=A0A1J4JKB4_9EUKA|nr:hypothetical protein TRFO_33942 [Tritrichomonas foetus]|eukprot:OHS99574.1 hypothetical protein TRFO_33942 [Tritrichomonas foetus]
MLLFLVCYFNFPDYPVLYRGNYSVYKAQKYQHPIVEKMQFKFIIRANRSICPQCSELSFQLNDTQFIKTTNLKGIFSSDNSSFFFFGIQGKDQQLLNVYKMIGDAMSKHNLTEPYNQQLIREEIMNNSKMSIFRVYCVVFNITTQKQDISAFLSDHVAKGHIFSNGKDTDLDMNFTAFQFNEFRFISEGKIFGLYLSIGVFISFIAWNHLFREFRSHVQLSHLSVHSFVLHLAFDYNYGLFLYKISNYSQHLYSLFTILAMIIIVMFFTIESYQLRDIWIASLTDIDEDLYHDVFIDFFLEITIALFIYSTAFDYLFESPYICIILLYSFFIPQIFHSLQDSSRKTNDIFFNISISIVRLLPIFYFSCYKSNIFETYSPSVAIFAIIYVSIQNIIIIIQNIFGGNFFVPKSMRPVPYNYFEARVDPGTECPICLSQIEAGEDTMVTPCRHCFHQGCLERWMEEKLVCPVCRTRLPVVEMGEQSNARLEDGDTLL